MENEIKKKGSLVQSKSFLSLSLDKKLSINARIVTKISKYRRISAKARFGLGGNFSLIVGMKAT